MTKLEFEKKIQTIGNDIMLKEFSKKIKEAAEKNKNFIIPKDMETAIPILFSALLSCNITFLKTILLEVIEFDD